MNKLTDDQKELLHDTLDIILSCMEHNEKRKEYLFPDILTLNECQFEALNEIKDDLNKTVESKESLEKRIDQLEKRIDFLENDFLEKTIARHVAEKIKEEIISKKTKRGQNDNIND